VAGLAEAMGQLGARPGTDSTEGELVSRLASVEARLAAVEHAIQSSPHAGRQPGVLHHLPARSTAPGCCGYDRQGDAREGDRARCGTGWQVMQRPPSTTPVCPVTNEPASLARNSSAADSSSASPIRPSSSRCLTAMSMYSAGY